MLIEEALLYLLENGGIQYYYIKIFLKTFN